jgi:hypothetical protein
MSILSRTIQEIFGAKNRSASATDTGLPEVENIRQQEGGGIICFAGGSEGDALANLTRELIAPIAGKASRVWMLNLGSPTLGEELNRALQEPVWFAYSFFAIGQDTNAEIGGCSRNVWEACGIPFLRMFGDIPAYFPDRHVRKFSNSINGYGDRSHLDFYKRWFDNKALTALLPALSLESKSLDEIDEDLKVKGSIIFPKNGNSPNALLDYWRASLPHTVVSAMESVAEACISQDAINDELHIDDRIIRCYEDIGVDIAADRTLMCFMVAQIDDYVRRIKSTMVAEAILDLPVIVQGSSWGHVNFYGKKARLESCSDYATTSALFGKTLAMIDMSANTIHAPHDRICRATGHGTAFLTNQQEFIGKIIPNPSECAFRFTKDSIHDMVEHYVLNPRVAVSLGIQQARGFRELYTAERYASALVSVVDAMSLRLGGRPYGTQNFIDFPPKDFS